MSEDTLPAWWPEWMTAPTRNPMHGGAMPLGQCKECHAQQYPHSFRESHSAFCSRHEAGFLGARAPWPYLWDGK